MTVATQANPLLSLDYVPALESIGDDYYDEVAAAEFPQALLRFRNDAVLQQLELDPAAVSDDHFVEAFGQFQGRSPFLALRYHGYQFGAYNAFLGDGRGFLYGQVRGQDGQLYDFGTKGSGTTPYSRGGDGRLTLKGGVREVLAAEALHALGVRTSRTLSMIETGEQLFRGDEPSPTRSSVMVRFSRSHIRFGTFERLDYLDRTDLIQRLLEHVIEYYYPTAQGVSDRHNRYLQFYRELVERTAELVAQWMSVGFCHAVLNTDNMSITGESFDYGPYAFIDQYDPKFTAAYFDYGSRYCYRNQPAICQLNLKMLQKPLQRVMPQAEMEAVIDRFEDRYWHYYSQRMLHKLGFESLEEPLATDLINQTLDLLNSVSVGYHDFFCSLAAQFSPDWVNADAPIFAATMQASDAGAQALLEQWRQRYQQALQTQSAAALTQMSLRLRQTNPQTVLLRPKIEAIWEPIVAENDWEPFYQLLKQIQQPFDAA
ncbi:YdiU family protein [Halomicronema sp. CCY15110]|uniref:protein adenylyltransferase SelO n=1 Tax=Halomicronema sp. CCY15110 TaxID=2767773 RepID=UPI0019506E00|nr:YdiU family protein [Halomicronema sp. CCY15110]